MTIEIDQPDVIEFKTQTLAGLGAAAIAFTACALVQHPEATPEQLERSAKFYPMGRLGKPEEYAKLALAIVENPMLNGQCLRLDAGQRFAPK